MASIFALNLGHRRHADTNDNAKQARHVNFEWDGYIVTWDIIAYCCPLEFSFSASWTHFIVTFHEYQSRSPALCLLFHSIFIFLFSLQKIILKLFLDEIIKKKITIGHDAIYNSNNLILLFQLKCGYSHKLEELTEHRHHKCSTVAITCQLVIHKKVWHASELHSWRW